MLGAGRAKQYQGSKENPTYLKLIHQNQKTNVSLGAPPPRPHGAVDAMHKEVTGRDLI